MATCIAENVPRGGKTLRNCSLNRGNLQGVQGVQAFIELRPVRPKIETRMVIQVGISPRDGEVTYWRGRQTGNYGTFSRDLTEAGKFDVIPFLSMLLWRKPAIQSSGSEGVIFGHSAASSGNEHEKHLLKSLYNT